MHEPDVSHHEASLGNEITIVDVILGRAMGDRCLCLVSDKGSIQGLLRTEGSNGMPAHNFLGKSLYVRERVTVGEGWETVRANGSIDFGLNFLLNVREECQSQK